MAFFHSDRSGCRTTPQDEGIASTVTPVNLSTVVVVALSKEAYSTVALNPTVLLEYLQADDRILSQGDVISLQNSKHEPSFSYRLQLLEPVRQGRAQTGQTEITILSLVATPPITLAGNSVQDPIEIDESFLACLVLNSRLEDDKETPTASQDRMRDHRACGYKVKYLDTPTELLQEHWTLYIRTSDLSKMGILNHDWAIAYTRLSHSRLVRIIANDDLVDSPAFVTGSPELLHNILGEASGLYGLPSLYLSPSPFGSYTAIPTAQTITVASVASPLSINRRYQSLLVIALRSYFESGRKFMKTSDIFAVPIDTDACRNLESIDEENVPEDSFTAQRFSHLIQPRRYNEVLYFKVTKVECDPIPKTNYWIQDVYEGSKLTLGELGCWVDPDVTRILQMGTEHSRLPVMGSYVQLDQLFKRQKHISPHLLGPESPFSKLLSLTSATLSRRAMNYQLGLTFLLQGVRGVGKFTVTRWVAQDLGLHLNEVDCYELLEETEASTEATLRVRFEQASRMTPCLLVLRHLEALSQTTQSQGRDAKQSAVNAIKDEIAKLQTIWTTTGYPLILVGVTNDNDQLPGGLANDFKHVINFEAPNENERLEILKCLLVAHDIAPDLSLQHIASHSAALVARDLRDLVSRAEAACFARVGDLERDAYSMVSINAADFEIALMKARESYSESIGAPKIPKILWADVGGLAHVKTEILDTIQLPLAHPEFFADGLKKRSGILLYGPPGTGKTLIAKAVATSFSLNFFSVKGPELLNMYIGESEANVRRVFQRAREARPCVIFFDELDAVAPKRGNYGDSGGVMDRIVSQLLAELDGISSGKGASDVFVIGATNRPDMLDPALLRPGRFDRLIYLGVPQTHDAQLKILEALTRKFRLEPGLDLGNIAGKCTFNYTGADFYALCSDAMLNAMSRKAREVEQNISTMNAKPQHPHAMTAQYYLAELASQEETEVIVTIEDFERALLTLAPSVSQSEMEHYIEVQKQFERKGMET